MQPVCHDYDDIIDLPHHRSAKHRPMPTADRAAQFSPFAALVGYDDCVQEAARLTEGRRVLSEEEQNALDAALAQLCRRLDRAERPAVELCCFVPDLHKEGGAYRTVRGRVRRISLTERLLVLEDGTEVELENVVEVREDE